MKHHRTLLLICAFSFSPIQSYIVLPSEISVKTEEALFFGSMVSTAGITAGVVCLTNWYVEYTYQKFVKRVQEYLVRFGNATRWTQEECDERQRLINSLPKAWSVNVMNPAFIMQDALLQVARSIVQHNPADKDAQKILRLFSPEGIMAISDNSGPYY